MTNENEIYEFFNLPQELDLMNKAEAAQLLGFKSMRKIDQIPFLQQKKLRVGRESMWRISDVAEYFNILEALNEQKNKKNKKN